MGPPSHPLPAVDKTTFEGCSTPLHDDNDACQVPTLEQLGVAAPDESSNTLFPGGETEALRRLEEHMQKEVGSQSGFLWEFN